MCLTRGRGGRGLAWVRRRQCWTLHPYQRQSLPSRWELYAHGLLDLRGYGELLLREQGLLMR